MDGFVEWVARVREALGGAQTDIERGMYHGVTEDVAEHSRGALKEIRRAQQLATSMSNVHEQQERHHSGDALRAGLTEFKAALGRALDSAQEQTGELVDRAVRAEAELARLNEAFDSMRAYARDLEAELAQLREALEDRACPCLYVIPCDPQCTCVNGGSSRGCSRCCSYGSIEQRRAKAERLAAALSRLKALEEWKQSILGLLQTYPEFEQWEWGGDKTGWGFCFEFIKRMVGRVKALEKVADEALRLCSLPEHAWEQEDYESHQKISAEFSRLSTSGSTLGEGER